MQLRGRCRRVQLQTRACGLSIVPRNQVSAGERGQCAQTQTDEQPATPTLHLLPGRGASAEASSGCLAEHRNLAASKQQELLSHNTTGQKSKLKVSEGQAPSQASGGGSPPGFFQLLPAPSISGSGRWNPSLSLVFPVQAGPTPVWPQPN